MSQMPEEKGEGSQASVYALEIIIKVLSTQAQYARWRFLAALPHSLQRTSKKNSALGAQLPVRMLTRLLTAFASDLGTGELNVIPVEP